MKHKPKTALFSAFLSSQFNKVNQLVLKQLLSSLKSIFDRTHHIQPSDPVVRWGYLVWSAQPGLPLWWCSIRQLEVLEVRYFAQGCFDMWLNHRPTCGWQTGCWSSATLLQFRDRVTQSLWNSASLFFSALTPKCIFTWHATSIQELTMDTIDNT